MNRNLALACVLALVFTAGCQAAVPDADPAQLAIADVPRASAAPDGAARAAEAINAFGLDLYRAAVDARQNIVLSPASIALALAMARTGAAGQTAAEMDAVLRGLGADAGAAWLNALDQALSGRSGTYPDIAGQARDVTLRIANAPFAQRGLALEPAFLEALARRYGAGLRLVDYQDDADGARRQINAWVDERTEQRIRELLQPGTVDDLTRLVLVNAIYLKAPWKTPFLKEMTTDGPFTRLDGSSVSVPLMVLGETLSYAAGDGWQAVELPYVGGSLAMTILVPEDLASFEASLDTTEFAAITGALEPRRVSLTFPRFGIETKASLLALLGALGMPTAFDPDRADFSGITPETRLFITDVIHQANIDVDEVGTEAAAATAVVMAGTSAPPDPVTLRVDRPFLFALRDVPTGAVLFLGHVVDPSLGR